MHAMCCGVRGVHVHKCVCQHVGVMGMHVDVWCVCGCVVGVHVCDVCGCVVSVRVCGVCLGIWLW